MNVHASAAGARSRLFQSLENRAPFLSNPWKAAAGAALACCLAAPAAQAEVTAVRGERVIPTYPWRAAGPHPYFRGTDHKNIYPYPMLDNLSREKTNVTYWTVVLENEFLRVTFLPDLGGKILEVIDKSTGQSMFYLNHVIKPGLVGQCGAWTSGGVEWNIGPQGHTVCAMQPVDVAILPRAADGARSVVLGDTLRVYGTRWSVLVTLRPGRSFLEERIRIYNATESVRPYYFWNCTAEPDTPGFRFVYPMTLGSDHGAETFFRWPVDRGRDLSRGTNYQDAASIFAWHCDQDFFGSYDDGADRGVVSFANHHQVRGKKAWTWGRGRDGALQQANLTDEDGPYNEVQTGPLLTQGEVGRLDPSEEVGWQEWWYPVHGIGGFTFANREVAANAERDQGRLRLRLLGTGTWAPVEVRVAVATAVVARAKCNLSPRQPAEISFDLAEEAGPLTVEVAAGETVLASFRVPLDLPERNPPEKQSTPATAAELAAAGWQSLLLARFTEAGLQFTNALALDARSVPALTGLAELNLDRDPAKAAGSARAALAADARDGRARFALAVAEYRLGGEAQALEEAWEASLDPATATAGRALAAKILLRRGETGRAIAALADYGPWRQDATCRNRLALAMWKKGERKGAAALAQATLADDPLDAFARCMLWVTGAEGPTRLGERIGGRAQPVLDLVAEFSELGQEDLALRIVEEWYCSRVVEKDRDPIPFYWAAWLAHRQGRAPEAGSYLRMARSLPAGGVAPHRRETEPALRWALAAAPDDHAASLYLGHLLFSLGRHDEGRAFWERAARSGPASSIAWRALGMAALNLDGHPESAVALLTKARDADARDPIIAADLARACFAVAGRTNFTGNQQALYAQARDALRGAFESGRSRSDFIVLLARAQNRLGQFAETARLLDGVRLTLWEGSRDTHDLFEEAHLELGRRSLDAGRATEALVEFDRALEYPENLGAGRLETTCDAHIHHLRGRALAALGRKADAADAWRKAIAQPASKDEKKEAARRQAREALTEAGVEP